MCADVRGMGVVAGAVVGVSFGVLLIILIIWLVFRKKEMKKYEEEETPNEIRYRMKRNFPYQSKLLNCIYLFCLFCVSYVQYLSFYLSISTHVVITTA